MGKQMSTAIPCAVKVKVPGSTANMGPGYDTLGMAISLFLTAAAHVKKGRPVLHLHGEGSDELPVDASNLMYHSYLQYGSFTKQKLPALDITVDNQIPLKRGLGSSSAAIVTGILLGEVFSSISLSIEELVNLASAVEGHPDNVTPCLLGGITICCNVDARVVFQTIRPPKWLKMVAVIPGLEVETQKAREILPKTVPLQDAVFNIQRVALQVARLHDSQTNSQGLIFEDCLHQKYRKRLIPGFDDVVNAAKSAGATGVYLSGSGPAIMALYSRGGKKIGNSMVEAFAGHNLSARMVLLQPVSRKPRIQILERS